jgi:hypothetical protein
MLQIALKEWHLLCSALLQGQQSILLRKGGILESNNEFELEHPRFLLFPTYIHQDPASVKPAWRDHIVKLPKEPDQITIEGWAEVVKIFEVPSRPAMDALDDLHLWDKPLIDMRFNYRPNNPLYLMVVRAWRLAQSITVPYTIEYAGCKSWVPLETPVPAQDSVQAMDEAHIQRLLARVSQTFQKSRP